MTYTVLPGKHYSRPWRLRLYLFKKRWQWTCKFHDVRHKPDGSTHKLVGVGFGLNHHRNSIRVGWQYNSSKDVVDLYAYVYKDGVRTIEYMCSIAHKVDFDVVIDTYSKHWSIAINWNGLNLTTKHISGGSRWFGYFLKPYFGGVATSTVTLKIEVG